MQTVQRNDKGEISHILHGNKFIPKEEFWERQETIGNKELTLSELDAMPQTGENIKFYQYRNNLICDYADILNRTNGLSNLHGKDLMDWRDAIDFKEGLSDKQEIELFEDQYKINY